MHHIELREHLMQAIIAQDAVEAQRLLDLGASVKYGTYHNYMNAPPLCHAAAEGSLDIVKILLEYGADIEGRSEWDCTPLVYAADANHLDIMRYLVAKGANINAAQCCGSILLCVIRKSSPETIQFLLEKGVDVHSTDNNGYNTMDWALEAERFDLIALLTQYGSRRESRRMYLKEYQLAPATEIVRYLSIFQRTLTAIIDYTGNDDKEGILLGGHLADALHNVPQMLLSYGSHGPYTTGEISDWLQVFPKQIQRYGASEQIIRDAKQIVSLNYDPSELELDADLTRIAFAPETELRAYFTLLHHACLDLRLMRNYGRKSVGRTYHPFEDVDQVWSEEAYKYAAFCQNLATVLLPLLKGLVHWKRFDAEHFWQEGSRLLGDDWDSYWSKFIAI